MITRKSIRWSFLLTSNMLYTIFCRSLMAKNSPMIPLQSLQVLTITLSVEMSIIRFGSMGKSWEPIHDLCHTILLQGCSRSTAKMSLSKDSRQLKSKATSKTILWWRLRPQTYRLWSRLKTHVLDQLQSQRLPKLILMITYTRKMEPLSSWVHRLSMTHRFAQSPSSASLS